MQFVVYFAIFYKGVNLSDFLFAFFHTKTLSCKGSTKENYCSNGEIRGLLRKIIAPMGSD